MRRLRSAALYTLLAGMAVAGPGCRENAKVAQASRGKADELTRAQPTPPQQQDPAASIEEQRVYIDASVSMRGFANAPRSANFHEFIDAIGDAVPNCILYKFGQRGPNAPEDSAALIERTGFGLDLHRPEFYNLIFNPDDRLIEQLAGEERPILSILITDGVYSEPRGSTAPPVVNAIQKWMERGRAFGILSFTSPFSGPFYSERSRRLLPALTVEARPFYAFVFSPTERGFRELQRRLQLRFPEQFHSIFFSDNAVAYNLSLPSEERGTYSVAQPPNDLYYWQMFDAELFDGGNPARVGYNVEYTSSPEYPATGFTTEVSADYYRWDGSGFVKGESPPQGFRAELGGGKGAAAEGGVAPPAIVVHYPKDSSTGYGFYHLRLRAEATALRPDILERSTRDDSLQENANQTFRFYEMISALTDIHFKTRLAPKLSPSIFVTVHNY